jgi:hypothetical protein
MEVTIVTFSAARPTHLLIAPLLIAAASVELTDSRRASAEPPWARLSLFRRVEAQPNQMYVIDENNGPWMVMAATFSGEQADEDARELVYDLRKYHKLDAYTHRMTFDFTEPIEGRDSNGDVQRMRYQNATHRDEIAVLVGNFESVDDPRVPKLVEKLKYLQPESLSGEDVEKTSLVLAGLRKIQRSIKLEATNDGDQFVRNVKQNMGPLGNAFVTTNPLLPRSYFVPGGVDSFVERINDDLQYSLLDCGGNYTIQVAAFRGFSAVDPKMIEKISERETSSNLAAAAESAHRLTLKLREKGYEAYEYHERSRSVVTVGSFAQLGSQGQDGTFELVLMLEVLSNSF